MAEESRNSTKPKKQSTKRKQQSRAGSLEGVTPSDALEILYLLHDSDPGIAELIEQTIEKHLKAFDIPGIAEEISFDLGFLRAEEVWDRAGSTRYGYVDSDEAAVELFEDMISSHVEKMCDLQERGMQREAGRYCRGIIQGIQKYKTESTSDFKDWIGDGIQFVAWEVFDTWKKGCTSESVRNQTEQKIKEQWSDLFRR